MANLVRDFRAGKLELFAPPGTARPQERPGQRPRPRPGASSCAGQGLSCYEISARLAAEGTPLNRTGVGQILAEEGFGRLLRGPEPEASISPATAGRDTQLPRAAVIDFGAFPARAETTAGRAAARRPGPGRPGPARPGRAAGVPRHPHHPRGLAGCCPCSR